LLELREKELEEELKLKEEAIDSVKKQPIAFVEEPSDDLKFTVISCRSDP